MEYVRDDAMYAAIFGMASCAWFGWAQENPKNSWRKYLGIASGIALLISLVGVYLSITNWHASTALAEADSFTNYSIVFYVEVFLSGLGAFWLIRRGNKGYVAPWIAFVVGTHFFFLKSVFKDPGLNLLAVLLIAVAAVSPALARKVGVASSAITGIGSGAVLLCFAVIGLFRFVWA